MVAGACGGKKLLLLADFTSGQRKCSLLALLLLLSKKWSATVSAALLVSRPATCKGRAEQVESSRESRGSHRVKKGQMAMPEPEQQVFS
jgi:hypothetical protein